MDFAKIIERMQHSVQRIPWNAQTFSLLTLAIGAVLAMFLLQRPDPQVSVMDELFGGRVLSVSELEPIEAAFGNAELATYSVQGGKLLVPRAERSRYYAELQKADCLPSAFHASTREALNVGSFLESPRKASERSAHARELEARSAICSVTGVLNAYVFFDEQRGRGFGDVTFTAAVGVRTLPDQPLDLQSYRVIQDTLLGLKAGLRLENITITDLNARRAIRGAIDPTSPDVLAIIRDSLERRWQSRLHEALSFVPDARIDVNVVPDQTGARARAVSVAVGVPATYIATLAATSDDIDGVDDMTALTEKQIRQTIVPMLPQISGASASADQLVNVNIFETPADRIAKRSVWTNLTRSPALVFGLVVAIMASLSLLLMTGNRSSEIESVTSQLRVYIPDETTSEANSADGPSQERPTDIEQTERLRAFVADDPEAAAKSLSEFIDRAS